MLLIYNITRKQKKEQKANSLDDEWLNVRDIRMDSLLALTSSRTLSTRWIVRTNGRVSTLDIVILFIYVYFHLMNKLIKLLKRYLLKNKAWCSYVLTQETVVKPHAIQRSRLRRHSHFFCDVRGPKWCPCHPVVVFIDVSLFASGMHVLTWRAVKAHRWAAAQIQLNRLLFATIQVYAFWWFTFSSINSRMSLHEQTATSFES